MLKELHLENVGPAQKFGVEFGPRLNLFTGDNGLGKTFLLEVAWWALTRTWVNNTPLLPERRWQGLPQISYRLVGSRSRLSSRFYHESQRWSEIQGKFPDPASLVIYMRVDDGFSVWDPARAFLMSHEAKGAVNLSQHFDFTLNTLWNGLIENGRTRSKGLIADWVSWQYQPDQAETDPFPLLQQALQKLSPHPDEWIKPGRPIRVSVEDVRDIPTVDLPYGNIPVTNLSAGMKRILSLAYLLIWTWYEHVQASPLLKRDPTNSLVLLIDEVESHLHPQWQRSLLPSILELGKILQPKLEMQIITTTHAPLVLASVEPYFEEDVDRLFLFELKEQTVTLTQFPWTKQGDKVVGLTPQIFDFMQTLSKVTEIAKTEERVQA